MVRSRGAGLTRQYDAKKNIKGIMKKKKKQLRKKRAVNWDRKRYENAATVTARNGGWWCWVWGKLKSDKQVWVLKPKCQREWKIGRKVEEYEKINAR